VSCFNKRDSCFQIKVFTVISPFSRIGFPDRVIRKTEGLGFSGLGFRVGFRLWVDSTQVSSAQLRAGPLVSMAFGDLEISLFKPSLRRVTRDPEGPALNVASPNSHKLSNEEVPFRCLSIRGQEIWTGPTDRPRKPRTARRPVSAASSLTPTPLRAVKLADAPLY
jgi:hypothetical protein